MCSAWPRSGAEALATAGADISPGICSYIIPGEKNGDPRTSEQREGCRDSRHTCPCSGHTVPYVSIQELGEAVREADKEAGMSEQQL